MKRFVAYIAVLVTLVAARAGAAQTVGVAGDRFTIDLADGAGPHAKFLLFISYFDALRATDPAGDLAYIANTLRFDGIRVLPNWQRRLATYCPEETADRLFDASGKVRGDTTPATGPLKKLIDLIETARRHTLVVDVTFTRDTVPGLSVDNYIRAVTRTSTLLRPYRNVIFDLDNEVELHGMTEADIRRLRDAIVANADPKIGDPHRIVMASRSGDISDVAAYNTRTQMNAVAYHDPREADWAARVPAVVATLRAARLPVYLQEPQAWNSGLSICGSVEGKGKDADGDPEDFRTAVRKARTSGAAAWTFHTRQSFRLHAGGSLRSRIRANPAQKALLESLYSTR